MRKHTLLLLLLLGLPCLANMGRAQCNPAAPEIPGNGVDEDCDGLDDIYLALPTFIYGTEGQDLEIYFRNIVLTKHPWDYVFIVNTAVGGTATATKWTWTPGPNAAGTFPLVVTVKSSSGQTLATGTTTLRISPDDAPADLSPKKLMLFGHSFFDQGYLPKYVYDLTHQPGNPPITFFGKKSSWANNLARHEGHGGQTARWFYENPGSPIRYAGKVNMPQYFNEVYGPGQRPDWVVYHLDINDFCGYTPLIGTTLQEIDDTIISHWNRYAIPLMDSIRAAAPGCKIAVCISPPPNARESSFAIAYPNNPVLNNRWRWQKVVSRLIFKNLQRYNGRENQGIYIIPEYLDIDDFDEYNPPDPRHPDPPNNNINTHCGYNEIAKSIYAWIRWVEHNPSPGGPPPPPPSTFTAYRDADGDGYGKNWDSQQVVVLPTGYAGTPGDCNDANPNIYPGAPESCTNQLDDDCDNITDEDSTPPIARCKTTLNLALNASGSVTINPAQLDDGSTDACSPSLSRWLNRSQFSCAEMGINFVDMHVVDLSGNEGKCETAVVISDATPPNALCANVVALPLNVSGQATLSPAMLNNGSFDVCTPVTFSLSQTAFDCQQAGQNLTITLTVRDAFNNQSSCTSLVRVRDNKVPMARCKTAALPLALDGTGTAALDVWQIDDGSWDACGPLARALDLTQFTCSDIGPKTVKLTVTDANGNTATCSAQVLVRDETPPLAHCTTDFPTVAMDAGGLAQIAPGQINDGSWDACGPLTFALDRSTFSCADAGTQNLTLTVTDAAGNTATCSAFVDVRDQSNPTVRCKTDIALPLGPDGTAQLSPAILDDGSTDGCGGPLAFSLSRSGFDCSQLGTHLVTMWAHDLSGNVGQCQTLVQVADQMAPDLGLPTTPEVELALEADGTATLNTPALFFATDNCSTPIWMQSLDNQNFTDGESFVFNCSDMVGGSGAAFSVWVRARDAAGNESALRQINVRILDNIPPTVVCKNIVVAPDASGQITVEREDLLVSVGDNCGTGNLQAIGPWTFTCTDLGQTRVINLEARDAAGNTGICQSVITVFDAADADNDGTSNCADPCPEDPSATEFLSFFTDADQDGFGYGPPVLACSQPPGTARNGADCNDFDPEIFPGATETANNLDDDCDGLTDEGTIATNSAPEKTPGLKIFPNPAAARFSVEWNAPEIFQPETAWLTDALGRSLRVFEAPAFSFGKLVADAASLPPGIYFFRIKFRNGAISGARFQKV